ncbi:MAG: xanthine dehydrogenase family protein molybdopterin-binding subunit [Gammaproteobacteria bacterium]|nr:xanthine dehydrogenase family protein molybdopterin-binding subunit [Gammaproteobacteria bacterium]
MPDLSRRAFFISGGLAAGGLALGYVLYPGRPGVCAAHAGAVSLVTWLRLHPDNTVTVLVPHVEMGQGSQTALAMMLADELDVNWPQVRVEQAPAQTMFATGDVVRVFLLGNRALAPGLARLLDLASYRIAAFKDLQLTGGSLSIRSTGRLGMRRAGAAAREMLLRAAAGRWGVSEMECVAERGRVIHAPSGRSASYGDLADAAAQIDPPSAPRLKLRGEYRICGQSPTLIHAQPAVRGVLMYGADVAVPGMQYAAIRHVPAFAGAIAEFDATAVSGYPGVRAVLRIPGAVAVVAGGYWQAQRALEALPVRFTAPAHPAPDSGALDATFDRLLTDGDVQADFRVGEGFPGEGGPGRVIAATYAVPFLAHATLEPMNCTAWLHDSGLEIWTGTQDPLGTRAVAAQAAGLDEKAVTVHALHLGGGFGRRTPRSFNYVEDAVHIARRVAYPVKLLWSREEDIRHDRFRPAGKSRFEAVVNDAGDPTHWRQIFTDIGFNEDREAARIPYAIPNRRIGRVTHEVNVPLGYWRSVEHSYQGFFIESFIDELAHAAHADPVQFRLKLLAGAPRFLRVLERAAAMIGWGKPVPGRRGRGIAIKESFGTVVAEAAEVEVGASGDLQVLRICAAVDAGEIVHPHNARAQVEGGILFGLGAALKGRVTLSGGSVVQGNFDDYPVLTMAETPAIDVEFLETDAPMGGIGEVGVPPVAPAVCNAVFAACGVRIRRLPIIGQSLVTTGRA